MNFDSARRAPGRKSSATQSLRSFQSKVNDAKLVRESWARVSQQNQILELRHQGLSGIVDNAAWSGRIKGCFLAHIAEHGITMSKTSPKRFGPNHVSNQLSIGCVPSNWTNHLEPVEAQKSRTFTKFHNFGLASPEPTNVHTPVHFLFSFPNIPDVRTS